MCCFFVNVWQEENIQKIKVPVTVFDEWQSVHTHTGTEVKTFENERADYCFSREWDGILQFYCYHGSPPCLCCKATLFVKKATLSMDLNLHKTI